MNTVENCTTSAEKRYDTRCKRAPEGHTIKYLTVAELNQNNTNVSIGFDYLLVANPDPASNNSDIQYVLPNDNANYELRLIDNIQNIGNIMYTANVDNTITHNISVGNYVVGVYTIAIFRNSQQVATIQFLIARM